MLSSTRFSTLGTRGSLAVALSFLAVAAWFLVVTLQTRSDPLIEPLTTRNDIEHYQAIVDRLKAGEDYYVALGSELRARNYPTMPVFNWRTPLHLMSMAVLPSFIIQAALIGALIASIMLQYRWMIRLGLNRAFTAFCCFLTISALTAVGVPSAQYFSEVWAGLFIWLSVGCYANKWIRLGIFFGLLALFTRELAIFYVLAAVITAFRRRDSGEVRIWAVGLVLYAVYYATHYYFVHSSLTEADHAVTRSWLALGGPAFLVETTRMNPFAGFLPLWARALIIPMALYGAIANQEERTEQARLSLFFYMAFFTVAGLPFNFYWGAVYSALIAWAFAWALPALWDIASGLIFHRSPGRA